MNRKEKDATGASEWGRPHELFLIIGQYVNDHNYTYLYFFFFFFNSLFTWQTSESCTGFHAGPRGFDTIFFYLV